MRDAWSSAAAPRCPQLYLYSERDALIPPSDVQAFMESQAQRGVHVESKCWADTQHCAHYQADPTGYTERVSTFISNCLAQRQQEDKDATDALKAILASEQAIFANGSS